MLEVSLFKDIIIINILEYTITSENSLYDKHGKQISENKASFGIEWSLL